MKNKPDLEAQALIALWGRRADVQFQRVGRRQLRWRLLFRDCEIRSIVLPDSR